MQKPFKAKYFPSCTILDCCPKPHHSWFWKNIIHQDNPILREGRWWIRNGFDIPLNHKSCFHSSSLNFQDPRLPTGMVKDLIDHNTSSWKIALVKALYSPQQARDIFQIPIPKTNSVQDKLVWRHSRNRDYQVRIAYELIDNGTLNKLRPP